MKICSCCKEEQVDSAFSKEIVNRDGLQRWCKGCASDWHCADKEKKRGQRENLPLAIVHRKRGMRPIKLDSGSAERLKEYMEENNLEHLFPPKREPDLPLKHLNPVYLAQKYRPSFNRERSRYEDLY